MDITDKRKLCPFDVIRKNPPYTCRIFMFCFLRHKHLLSQLVDLLEYFFLTFFRRLFETIDIIAQQGGIHANTTGKFCHVDFSVCQKEALQCAWLRIIVGKALESDIFPQPSYFCSKSPCMILMFAILAHSIRPHFISSPCLSYCFRLPTGGSVRVLIILFFNIILLLLIHTTSYFLALTSAISLSIALECFSKILCFASVALSFLARLSSRSFFLTAMAIGLFESMILSRYSL